MQELINEKTFQNFIRIFDVSCEKRWNIFLEQNDARHLRQAVLLALLRVVDLHDADPVLVATLRNHLDKWKEWFCLKNWSLKVPKFGDHYPDIHDL